MSLVNYGLKDKVVLVTGGSRGIGLEIARKLIAEQAKVVICGRKRENLDAAVESLGGGDDLLAVGAHAAKEEDVNRLFDAVKEAFGRLDVLVNNVGMNLMTGPASDTDPAAWRKILDSNLNGAFLCSRAAAAIMKPQGGGRIISITSVAAHRAAPGMGIYGVAKAGIEMMTKVLASELAMFNILVNAVAPGMVKTDFSKLFWSNAEIHDQIVKTVPLGRLADPVDVVHPVLFLASEGASYITGQTLMVDGGSTAV